MDLRLLQIRDGTGRLVAAAEGDGAPRRVPGAATVLDLAGAAVDAGRGLQEEIAARGPGEPVDVAAAFAEGRVLPAVDHPDPARCIVSVTGLTHLGSAESRDRMHRDLHDPAKETDSLRMFRLGLEGGKPRPGEAGTQPEWSYKGDGRIVVGPGDPLPMPPFAEDGGEEPEIAACHLIGPDGTPWRLGFVLGNEFSDHAMERRNYLYLAHSKLRACSVGGELLVGDLPPDVRGTSRILRGGAVAWEKPFLSGEANMCHSVANLEAHHFKYALFRRPGDLHVHFLGTATLSFADGFRARPGDVFELEAPPFRLPLRNPLARDEAPIPAVRAL